MNFQTSVNVHVAKQVMITGIRECMTSTVLGTYICCDISIVPSTSTLGLVHLLVLSLVHLLGAPCAGYI